INSSVVVRPYSSRYKVYIVDEAERMNVQAQNALLKTVEEPPEYVVILLLTTNADSFLPTILSRCVRLDLKPVDDSLIRSFLMRQHAVPDYRADLCVAFAQGNVGRAVMLASSNEFGEIKEATVSLIRKLDRLPLCDATAELAPITASKDDISTFLDLVLLLFRDVLLYKSTGAAEKLVFKDEEELVSDLALKIPFSGLNGILEAINKANLRISMNVNASMTLEMLLINIKENL
ncbi:MAG: DNA polymerase III subunit delta, partial [Clostridiales bacterium]|nr:DNA polymerase III subunit delta [Clostridiales bacterium]